MTQETLFTHCTCGKASKNLQKNTGWKLPQQASHMSTHASKTWAKHEWHASCMRADRHSKYLLVPFPYRYVDYMWTPGGLQVDSTWTPWTLRCYRCTNTWTPPGVCLDSRYTPQNSMDAPWSPPQPVAQYNDLLFKNGDIVLKALHHQLMLSRTTRTLTIFLQPNY
jgi:hypothetical protein